MSDTDPLRTRRETAKQLRVREQTLASWHCNGRYNLPVIKVGRSVRYRQSDIDAFLDSRTVSHGAATA